MFAGAFAIADTRMGVNYGLNRVRFTAPVPVGSRLRGRFKLLAYEPIAGGAQLTVEVTIEREGADKPVCDRRVADAALTSSGGAIPSRPPRRPAMKVLLIDDHPLILSALQTVIQGLGRRRHRDRRRQRPGGAPDAEEGRRLRPRAARPAARRRRRLRCPERFRAAYPALPVVVVSASDRASDVIRSIDLGAMGFVPKRSSNELLFEALRQVMSGGIYVPPMTLGSERAAAPPPAGDTVPSIMQRVRRERRRKATSRRSPRSPRSA